MEKQNGFKMSELVISVTKIVISVNYHYISQNKSNKHKNIHD